MRALASLAFLVLCAATPAAATTPLCLNQEFTVRFNSLTEPIDAISAETIAAAVQRALHCENATFVIMADGISREGPGYAGLVYDALVERGIDEANIRVDLLSPGLDRWDEALSNGAVNVNIYYDRQPPEQQADPMGCFDVAIVARILRYDSEIGYPRDDDGLIYMRWPWKLDLAIEQVLIGDEDRRNIQVWMSLHTDYRSEIDYFLFFLRRDANGDYVALDAETNVVLDRRGRFVIPVDAPLEPYRVRPEGWAPDTYEQYLRRIHYRSAGAWWLNLNNHAEAVEGWSELRRGRVVANRGLPLDALPDMMAAAPGAICDAD